MELKQASNALILNIKELLIVPYGIETTQEQPLGTLAGRLLIVPYGIETELKLRPVKSGPAFNCTLLELKHVLAAVFPSPNKLLIVPYGIETQPHQEERTPCNNLLIVPYGIETRQVVAPQMRTHQPFNCTSWN